jgi:outer membrane protein assembly factor BamD
MVRRLAMVRLPDVLRSKPRGASALLVAVAIAAAGAAGCEKQEPRTALSYTADAKRAYDEAMKEFQSHNWIESQALFREVKRKYHYSKYAKLAELRIADADFEQEKYSEAIRAYRQFVHDHRSDAEEVAYARSRIAEAQYRQISESFLLPTADERDQAVILDAFKELKGYIHDYPNSKESPKIRELLIDVTARLMRHELYVARFYLARDNFQAAVYRIQYAMRNFAGGPAADTPGESIDSGLEAEALLLLGEVYLKMKKFPQAREAFGAILREYPRSPLVVQASNYLAYMTERGV